MNPILAALGQKQSLNVNTHDRSRRFTIRRDGAAYELGDARGWLKVSPQQADELVTTAEAFGSTTSTCICAWCLPGYDEPGISHGLCAKCADDILRESETIQTHQ